MMRSSTLGGVAGQALMNASRSGLMTSRCRGSRTARMPWSLDGGKDGRALFLHEEHQQLGRRGAARVSADGVYVVGALIEGLPRRQGDGGSASDLHHDRAFEHEDDGLRI